MGRKVSQDKISGGRALHRELVHCGVFVLKGLAEKFGLVVWRRASCGR